MDKNEAGKILKEYFIEFPICGEFEGITFVCFSETKCIFFEMINNKGMDILKNYRPKKVEISDIRVQESFRYFFRLKDRSNAFGYPTSVGWIEFFINEGGEEVLDWCGDIRE